MLYFRPLALVVDSSDTTRQRHLDVKPFCACKVERGARNYCAHLDADVEYEGIHKRGVVPRPRPRHVAGCQQQAAGEHCQPRGGRPAAEVAVDLAPGRSITLTSEQGCVVW